MKKKLFIQSALSHDELYAMSKQFATALGNTKEDHEFFVKFFAKKLPINSNFIITQSDFYINLLSILNSGTPLKLIEDLYEDDLALFDLMLNTQTLDNDEAEKEAVLNYGVHPQFKGAVGTPHNFNYGDHDWDDKQVFVEKRLDYFNHLKTELLMDMFDSISKEEFERKTGITAFYKHSLTINALSNVEKKSKYYIGRDFGDKPDFLDLEIFTYQVQYLINFIEKNEAKLFKKTKLNRHNFDKLINPPYAVMKHIRYIESKWNNGSIGRKRLNSIKERIEETRELWVMLAKLVPDFNSKFLKKIEGFRFYQEEYLKKRNNIIELLSDAISNNSFTFSLQDMYVLLYDLLFTSRKRTFILTNNDRSEKALDYLRSLDWFASFNIFFLPRHFFKIHYNTNWSDGYRFKMVRECFSHLERISTLTNPEEVFHELTINHFVLYGHKFTLLNFTPYWGKHRRLNIDKIGRRRTYQGLIFYYAEFIKEDMFRLIYHIQKNYFNQLRTTKLKKIKNTDLLNTDNNQYTWLED